MACGPPGDAVERAFTAALPRVAGWQMDGDELVLVDDEDREVLRLAQASPVGDWDVTALRTPDAVTGPLEGTELTVDLAADGTVTGSAGCNRYRATFAVDGDALRIERGAATTRKTCPSPDGVMEQEAQLLEALASVARFERAGGTLTLLQEDGTIALTLVPR
jgi:heat shock protein HslJ